MLYLAEVKKQTKGFMGGFKTELKLLACQHNDQTWSPVPGDEILNTEEINQGCEGALWLLNLGNNRQIQDPPELAGPELVRQLQKLSRLSEKLKDQREEIEQWKQSLTYQSQELSRREMELEGRLEQLEEMEKGLQDIQRQRRELEDDWERLHQEQQNLESLQSRLGNPLNLASEQAEQVEGLINRLSTQTDGLISLWQPLNSALDAAKHQQEILNRYWQHVNQQKNSLQQRQSEIEQRGANLKTRQQQFESAKANLEQAKIQLQVQQNVLVSKQELLGRINLNLETTETLHYTLRRIALGTSNSQGEPKVDLHALENMPLGELEEMVKKLEDDLERVVRFVNDQEEELTVQCQTVEELELRLQNADAYERFSLETELSEEQECKGMLDRTLVGQRHNLKERQEILFQHIRILRRRQGIGAIEDQVLKINFDPLFFQLEELQNNTAQEKQRVETEIEHLQQSLHQIQEMISQQDTEQQATAQDLQIQQENWQQARQEVTQIESRLSIYQESLQPIQDRLDEIRPRLEELSLWLNPLPDEQQQMFV